MSTYGQVARSVAERKALYPERYCKYCLWNTAMLNPARDGYILNANPCPKHPVTRGSNESVTGDKAAVLVHQTTGKPIAVSGSIPLPRSK